MSLALENGPMPRCSCSTTHMTDTVQDRPLLYASRRSWEHLCTWGAPATSCREKGLIAGGVPRHLGWIHIEGRGERQHIGSRNKWGMTLFLPLKSCPESIFKNVWNEHHVVTKLLRRDPSQGSWMHLLTAPRGGRLTQKWCSEGIRGTRKYGLQPAWDSPGKNTGVGCHALLQGIFLTQGLNPCLLCLLHLAGGFFTTSATWEAHIKHSESELKVALSCPTL